MAAPFTIGIEEEFQMVDRQTGQLSPRIHTILEKGQSIFGEQIKAEMLQSMVEINSDIMHDIPTAREEMRTMRAKLAQLVGEEGLALISAGTHPAALWQNECRSEYVRYAELEDELQDVARSILIFGQHVHIGIEDHETAVTVMNQVPGSRICLQSLPTHLSGPGATLASNPIVLRFGNPSRVAGYQRYFPHGVILTTMYRL
jgi:carboxylate-amine ligase